MHLKEMFTKCSLKKCLQNAHFKEFDQNFCSKGLMEETSLMKFVKKKSKKWFLNLESMIVNNWVSK